MRLDLVTIQEEGATQYKLRRPHERWASRCTGGNCATNRDRKLALLKYFVIFLHCSIILSKEPILHTISSIDDAKALEGQEAGVSEWVTIDQERIDKFAEATGDFQWIHVDQERAAAELPNGTTIAHGYLTLALIPVLTGGFIEVTNLERAINFGCNKVRFYTMVPVGSRVRCRGKVLQARKRGGALHLLSEVRIEVEGEKKPACVAETLAMYFFEEEVQPAVSTD
jgi:acyl dehydratase